MKKILKKLATALAMIAIAAVFCFDGWTEAETRVPENLYPTCGIVTEVNYTENMVTFTDFNGNS